MKICKGWLQALLSPAPRGFAARSRVLARLASLAQTGELARRLLILILRVSDHQAPVVQTLDSAIQRITQLFPVIRVRIRWLVIYLSGG